MVSCPSRPSGPARRQAIPTRLRHPYAAFDPSADIPGAPPASDGTARACCDAPDSLAGLDTGDPKLAAAIARAMRVVDKDIPLLVLGESGVGKELFAKAFHRSGKRRAGPFVALNCAAIPEHLIESELLGYAGGAFTGARREGYAGRIRQANGGTLFLDEIGDMPLNLQARLLRVLQERTVNPLGSVKAVPVDLSLVCATHRNLPDLVRAGAFRQDLYYRINALAVTLPPLRERSDIRRLVRRLVAAESDGHRRLEVDPQVLAFFERYPWPGNLRQLHNAVRVAVALLDEHETRITASELPEELFALEDCGEEGGAPAALAAYGALPAGDSLEALERRSIEQALAQAGGNISAAARRLGISRNTLYRKLGRR